MSDTSDAKLLETLFHLSSQKSVIPYSDLCAPLSLSEEDLEDHLTTLILDGSANIKLDKTNKTVISHMSQFDSTKLSSYFFFFNLRLFLSARSFYQILIL